MTRGQPNQMESSYSHHIPHRTFSSSQRFANGMFQFLSDMSVRKVSDEVLNINVGGKRFSVRRSTLLADPASRLADWFRTNITTRALPIDRAGVTFLDRDGKAFRYILAYLRYKKEKIAPSFALPLKPDEIARVLGESEVLRLDELKEICIEMLNRYHRDEHNYVSAFVNNMLREYEDQYYTRRTGGKRANSPGLDEAYPDVGY